MLSLVPRTRDQSIIDMGTGTGRILEVFGRTMGRGVGIDLSHEMLSLARTRLDGAGLRECQVRHGDMYQLPVDDADFDIATLHLDAALCRRPDDRHSGSGTRNDARRTTGDRGFCTA